jgi:hypothetical protein
MSGRRRLRAGSLDELSAAYADITKVAGLEDVERDVSAWFVSGRFGLLALAGSLSLIWSQRLPWPEKVTVPTLTGWTR